MLDAIYEALMGAGGLFIYIYSVAMIRLIIHIEKMKTPVCNDENTTTLEADQRRLLSRYLAWIISLMGLPYTLLSTHDIISR